MDVLKRLVAVAIAAAGTAALFTWLLAESEHRHTVVTAAVAGVSLAVARVTRRRRPVVGATPSPPAARSSKP